MVQDFGEMHPATADNGSQLLDGSLEGVVVLRHDSIVVSHTILSRGDSIENRWALGQIEDMNLWPQRPFVRIRRVFLCPLKIFPCVLSCVIRHCRCTTRSPP